jgi:hypothetical protein
MTSDDQYFLDQLSRVSSQIRTFSANVFDATDKKIDELADSVAGTLNTVLPGSWSLRNHTVAPVVVHQSFLQQCQGWVSRHRALTAAVVAFVGTGAVVLLIQSNTRTKKRRAKRARNGSRKEIVGQYSVRFQVSVSCP